MVKVSRQHHPQGKTFLVRDYTKNGQTRRLKLDGAVVELVRGYVTGAAARMVGQAAARKFDRGGGWILWLPGPDDEQVRGDPGVSDLWVGGDGLLVGAGQFSLGNSGRDRVCQRPRTCTLPSSVDVPAASQQPNLQRRP